MKKLVIIAVALTLADRGRARRQDVRHYRVGSFNTCRDGVRRVINGIHDVMIPVSNSYHLSSEPINGSSDEPWQTPGGSRPVDDVGFSERFRCFVWNGLISN